MNHDCPDPELCSRLGLHIHGRLWDIWNDRVLTPQRCARYRAAWERQSQERRQAELQGQGPGLLGAAAGFLASAARHVAAGLPTLPPDQVEARLAVCRACDSYDRLHGTCRRCSCLLRLKASWALERCPLGLW